MPYETATYVASLNLEYPSDSGTASLLWLSLQDLKRTVKNTLPNLNSEVSANPFELNQLVGLAQPIITMMSDLSATIQAQKQVATSTGMAAIDWDGSAKFTGTATPSEVNNLIWFQIG